MEKTNKEEKLNTILESPKCFDCNINLEQYYTYCEICNKHFCLNCLFIHKHQEKMKSGNYQLKNIKLDKNHKEKKIDNSKSKIKNERHYGIDLLRIYAMINVVILHSLRNSKLLFLKKYSRNYYGAWFLETFCYSAVDTCGMISGYVMINTEFNGFKIIPLWFHFLYYRVLFIMTDFFLYKKRINSANIKNLLFSLCFPAINQNYWYYTCYFCMYFFIPFMNKVILLMNKSENKQLCITILIIFCILPFIILKNNDPFSIKRGFCPLWIMCLYIIGANLKLFPLQISKNKLMLLVFISVIIPWIIKTSHFINIYINEKKKYQLGIFIQYNSIFIVLNAIFLISFFSQLNIKNKLIAMIIETISPLTFGVYLIHNRILKKYFVRKISVLKNQHLIKMNLNVIIYSLQISLICLLIDYSRYIFFKLIKINKLPIKLKKIFS